MKIRFLIPFAFLLLALSCTREPIYDSVSRYRFEFSFPDDILWCKPEKPELIQVLFYDPQTGKKAAETFMSPDGGYLHAIAPGEWNIVAFGMGTTATVVDYTRDFNILSVHTTSVQSSPVKVVNSPDHLLVCTLTNVDIPQLSEADEPFILNIPLESVCDSWKIQVSGIKGVSYASSVSAVIFNQAAAVRLSDMALEQWSAIKAVGTVQDSLAVIPFCTFGMPQDGRIAIRVEIEAHDGQIHSQEFDITSQVRSPLKKDHVISVDFMTELLPLVQGGLDPQADDWQDHHENIEIE